jgi:hypothetical protein
MARLEHLSRLLPARRDAGEGLRPRRSADRACLRDERQRRAILARSFRAGAGGAVDRPAGVRGSAFLDRPSIACDLRLQTCAPRSSGNSAVERYPNPICEQRLNQPPIGSVTAACISLAPLIQPRQILALVGISSFRPCTARSLLRIAVVACTSPQTQDIDHPGTPRTYRRVATGRRACSSFREPLAS